VTARLTRGDREIRRRREGKQRDDDQARAGRADQCGQADRHQEEQDGEDRDRRDNHARRHADGGGGTRSSATRTPRLCSNAIRPSR
jgi:hypothetical protein